MLTGVGGFGKWLDSAGHAITWTGWTVETMPMISYLRLANAIRDKIDKIGHDIRKKFPKEFVCAVSGLINSRFYANTLHIRHERSLKHHFFNSFLESSDCYLQMNWCRSLVPLHPWFNFKRLQIKQIIIRLNKKCLLCFRIYWALQKVCL